MNICSGKIYRADNRCIASERAYNRRFTLMNAGANLQRRNVVNFLVITIEHFCARRAAPPPPIVFVGLKNFRVKISRGLVTIFKQQHQIVLDDFLLSSNNF